MSDVFIIKFTIHNQTQKVQRCRLYLLISYQSLDTSILISSFNNNKTVASSTAAKYRQRCQYIFVFLMHIHVYMAMWKDSDKYATKGGNTRKHDSFWGHYLLQSSRLTLVAVKGQDLNNAGRHIWFCHHAAGQLLSCHKSQQWWKRIRETAACESRPSGSCVNYECVSTTAKVGFIWGFAGRFLWVISVLLIS